MSSSSKRRTTPTPRPSYDEKLQRVAQVLENATRGAAQGASGTAERFPPPGLVFKGDDEEHTGDDPLLAQRKFATQLKARARVTQQRRDDQESDALAWEVAGSLLEARNARWEPFLLECFDQLRDALGISTAANVRMSLRKMVLLSTDAVLDVRRPDEEEKRHDGVFGTLVVALPGEFEGGSVTCRQPKTDQESKPQAHRPFVWEPTSRKSPNDLTFAAFDDHCTIEAARISKGTSLNLVYDLTTTAPNEIPLFVDPSALQRVVDTSLHDYFDVTPAPLAKRLKITADAWRTINEFTSKCHFAYIVRSKTFDGLDDKEQKVAKSLAAFCNNSDGKYVLYLSAVLCSRESGNYDAVNHTQLADGDGALQLTLKSPWLKHGEAVPTKFPPIRVDRRRHVAPLGRVDGVQLFDKGFGMGEFDIVATIHGRVAKTRLATMSALVVLPASLEQQQLTKVPMDQVVTKLHRLLLTSREQAVQFTRQVLRFRAPWTLNNKEVERFHDFVGVIVALNDLELFKDTVRSVILTHGSSPRLFRGAIDHFGWDACADTFVARILTTASLLGRANLIAAVAGEASDAERMDPLFDALVSQHPWTDVTVKDPNAKSCCESNAPAINSFVELLLFASASSFEMLSQVAWVTCSVALTEVVIPAVGRLKDRLDLESLRVLVRDLTTQLHIRKDVFRNEAFANVHVPTYCSNRGALATFLTSSAVETIIPFTGPSSEIQHLRTVLDRQVGQWISMTGVRSIGPNAARLMKSLESASPESTKRAEGTLKELAAVIDDRHRCEAW